MSKLREWISLRTNPNRSQEVEVRYRPSDGSLTVVAKHSVSVVGAGVSTCAPF